MTDAPPRSRSCRPRSWRCSLPSRGGLFVDCTTGLGGHSAVRCSSSGADAPDRSRSRRGRACDRRRAPGRASATASSSCTRTIGSSARVLDARGISGVDGVLADLGVSSMQLDADGRGFSFRRDEPLDMRMDRSQGPTARRPARRRRGRGPRQRDLPVRRGAPFAPDRAGHRPAGRESGRIETTGALADDRAPRGADARLPADRSGDAHVPGAADLGQPRARGARRVPGGRRRGGCWPARGSRSSRSTRSRTAS